MTPREYDNQVRFAQNRLHLERENRSNVRKFVLGILGCFSAAVIFVGPPILEDRSRSWERARLNRIQEGPVRGWFNEIKLGRAYLQCQEIGEFHTTIVARHDVPKIE